MALLTWMDCVQRQHLLRNNSPLNLEMEQGSLQAKQFLVVELIKLHKNMNCWEIFENRCKSLICMYIKKRFCCQIIDVHIFLLCMFYKIVTKIIEKWLFMLKILLKIGKMVPGIPSEANTGKLLVISHWGVRSLRKLSSFWIITLVRSVKAAMDNIYFQIRILSKAGEICNSEVSFSQSDNFISVV